MFTLLISFALLACNSTPPPPSVAYETYRVYDYGHGVYIITPTDAGIAFATVLGEFIKDHPELRVTALDGRMIVTRPAGDCE